MLWAIAPHVILTIGLDTSADGAFTLRSVIHGGDHVIEVNRLRFRPVLHEFGPEQVTFNVVPLRRKLYQTD
jgi:hypothetical protein